MRFATQRAFPRTRFRTCSLVFAVFVREEPWCTLFGSVPKPVGRKPQMGQHRMAPFHGIATVRAFGPQRMPSVWPCGAFPGIDVAVARM